LTISRQNWNSSLNSSRHRRRSGTTCHQQSCWKLQ